MSDKSRQSSVMLTNEFQELINFDGTGDCALFHKQFDACMREKGYGGVVSNNDYEVPLRPDDAFARVEIGVYNRSDGGDIAMYNKNNGQFLNRVEFVIACYKRALSQSVRSYLEMKFPIEYNSGNKENFDLLRKEALSKYGGWTDIKGKRNYTDMLDIPNIVDIESADSAFLKLRVLIEERAGWNRKEEIYGDNFYRVWLKDHINDWSRLTPIHTQMELHEEVTFTQGRDLVMKLVDIDREERGMHAKTLEHIKLQRLKDSKTIQSSTGFTFVKKLPILGSNRGSNPVSGSLEKSYRHPRRPLT